MQNNKVGQKDPKIELDYLQGCTLCEIGTVKEVDRLIKEDNLSIRKASEQMETDIAKASGGVQLFSANAIRCRYKKVKGGSKRPKVGQKDPKFNSGSKRPKIKKQKYNDLLLEYSNTVDESNTAITKLEKEKLFIMEQSGNIEREHNEKFQRLFQDFNRAYDMLSPIQRAKFDDGDNTPVQQNNKDFVEEFKKKRKENIKKMRILNGYNEDGTKA